MALPTSWAFLVFRLVLFPSASPPTQKPSLLVPEITLSILIRGTPNKFPGKLWVLQWKISP